MNGSTVLDRSYGLNFVWGVISRKNRQRARNWDYPSLIATDAEEYAAIAVRLGKEPDYRQSMSEQISQKTVDIIHTTAKIGVPVT